MTAELPVVWRIGSPGRFPIGTLRDSPPADNVMRRPSRKSGHQKEILKDFKEHFKLKVTSVRPENITLSEHGRFLRQAVEKYKDD